MFKIKNKHFACDMHYMWFTNFFAHDSHELKILAQLVIIISQSTYKELISIHDLYMEVFEPK